MKEVTVKSPATVANLVCGFDIMGLALNEPFDIMSVKLLDEPVVRIRHIDQFGLPETPEQNVAGVVFLSVMKQMGGGIGFEAIIEKVIKPGSGIGSSASSASAAAVAANHLLGNIFTQDQLVGFAMDGEQLASGSRHADNVAPCILGGITLVRSIDPTDIIRLEYPHLYVTVIHPQVEVKTSDARKVLKPEVPLKDAIHQWANVGGLVAGFYRKDYGLIARSLEDVIIEPQRSILIPGYQAVKDACRKTKALGGGISGSGPSLFMLSDHPEAAHDVEKHMKKVYDDLGIGYFTYVTDINDRGVEVVNKPASHHFR